MPPMLVPLPSALSARWGRFGLVSALAGLALCVSCTSSEDTEPFIPATEGAQQPSGSGALLSEADACERVREAARNAYERLHCAAPTFAVCPDYVRPGGASGCYEYYEASVAACEKAYEDARTCGTLAPCIVSAQRNEELDTCERLDDGGAGQGGGSSGGSTGAGGEGQTTPLPEGGAPAMGGAGAVPASAGAGGG